MPLTTGTRLGPYEIIAALGAGGMGEVYRATDTNLKRAVAIKVLPESVAADTERLARFQREAELLASLNHPHIAAVYGLERSGGLTALVMELVEGEDLSTLIASGHPGLPLADALRIAHQIAEALEVAHEHGIIHRDLKPANIKVTPDGIVKVLDFGLAKALAPAGMMSSNVSQSPTITTPAMTQAGMILGTAAYMSPEQARGRSVDKRADIWAFGCVLFEMLTGERPFKGEDIGETLAAVIRAEPSLDAVPAHLRPLLKSCLEKDPKKRLRDIGDIGLLLDRQEQPSPPPAPSRRMSWLWPALAAILLTSTSGLAWLFLRQSPPEPRNVRFEIAPPGNTPAAMFALSPDGTHLAFVSADDGPSRLWVRAMDALEPRALAGTDGATYPFWSPDGRSLAFFAQGKLKKIAIAGGPAQPLCDASSGRGGSWSRAGVIVFSAGPTSPILRVPSSGGVATPVTQVSGNAGHRFPAFLPDEGHFLFLSGSDDPAGVGLFVGALDGVAPVRLLSDSSNGLYAPPVDGGRTGFILFRRDESTLMAQPFDAANLRTAGEMFPVAEGIAQGGGHQGFGAFSVASSGSLVYRTGAGASRELWWVDRTGRRLGAVTKPAAITGPYRLSPDEKTLAMRIDAGGGQSELWLQNLERGVQTRFTFQNKVAKDPVWSPDGRNVVYSFQDVSVYSSFFYQKAAVISTSEELLLRVGTNGIPTDWSADGTLIVYAQQDPTAALDLWLLPINGDRKPVPYLRTPANETAATFLPDATGPPRFAAYQSDENGQYQVYVQAVPAAGNLQVSTEGGLSPKWRRDGRELYFTTLDRRLMAAPVTVGASIQVGTAKELFRNAAMLPFFIPSRDGERFLVSLPAGGDSQTGPRPITVVTNWQAGLAK